MNPSRLLKLSILLALICITVPVVAQERRALTADDYARAEKAMGYNTNPLVFRAGVRPSWMPGERFWYRITTPEGSEFVLIDPARGARAPAFDHAKLAAALSTAAGTDYDAHHLPFTSFEFSNSEQTISFTLRNRGWKCDLQANKCSADQNAAANDQAPAQGGRRGGRNEAPSPDKKRAAFIRDYNLWARDVATGKETQLTTDGVKDFGYATDNAGWIHSDRAILLWSPDSKRIATFQQDQRNVGEMYLVDTKVGHPTLQAWKYPLPGDETVAMIQRVIIDVDAPKVIRLQMPADQHRSSVCDHINCVGTDLADAQWSADSSQLAFLSNSRDHKEVHLRIADANTGALRDVLEEKVGTQFESGANEQNWRYVAASHEVIWFSERDNWGHLYLYDATTGKLKHQITKGDWSVVRVTRVDEKNRLIYFVAVGTQKGQNPYFASFHRIGFDGKNLTTLTPEDGNHTVAVSPSGRFFVDSYSKPDVPPVAVLRDEAGKLIAMLEKADISRLLATRWKPPTPFTAKGRDGETDIYGLMYQPANLDPNKKYPIVNHIYPGPQGGSVGGWSFSAARGDTQALADLGFIVVEIEGMGNPSRSKKFHDAYYANMGDNTLPDQVSGMKQLAQKYSFIDLDRVGIYGHSGGGFATADAMFRYPDFFKVGIAESGNHDNREYEDDWGERYQGLLERKTGGATNYDDQANQNLAKNLKGHLLLAHGTLDDNVPPNNTLLVVEALIKANKDFDLLMLPNQRHGYGNASNYMTRRRWDYFVRYLLGAEPPANYALRPPAIPGQ